MAKKVRSSSDLPADVLAGQFASEVRRHQLAQDLFDEAARARLGINRSDGRALDVIERRERVTAGHLADEIGLTSGATTTLIDRLERRGYVRRVRDDADRRRVHVELTDRARAEAAVIWGPMAREAATLPGRSSPEDIAAVLAFLRHSRGVLEHHARRVRALGPPEEISASP